MPNPALPCRLTDEARVATWNPALTRAVYVLIEIRRDDGGTELRRSMNSGRARVREGERIERVLAGEA